MMRKAVLLLFLLLSCAWSMLSASDWTVLVYMAADNNLWQNAVQDINDMESVALPTGLNLIVQSDMPQSSPYPGGQRRRIRQDSSSQITSPLLANLGQINSGDQQTLNNFVRWGFAAYPASRKMLVIWGHGDSWFKGDESKWICPDDDAQAFISVSNGDLKRALTNIPMLDILLFDACSMQSLEVLAEVQHAARRVIASAELVPATGFPYSDMLNAFTATATTDQVCTSIVDAYITSYDYGGSQNPYQSTYYVTCSAINTAELGSFYYQMTEFNLRYLTQAEDLLQARDGCWEMNQGFADVDVREYLSSVAVSAFDPGMRQDAMSLLDTWALARVRSANLNLPELVGDAALWFPKYRHQFTGWAPYYLRLSFANTRWAAILNRAYGADTEVPAVPTATSWNQVLGGLNVNVAVPLDPEDMTLLVEVITNSAKATYAFFIPWNAGSRQITVPVSASGTFILSLTDSYGNSNVGGAYDFTYEAPGLTLMTAPNPLFSGSGGMIRWFVPEGLEGEAELHLYDMRGRRLLHRKLGNLGAGDGFFMPALWQGFADLSKGVYLLHLKVGSRRAQCKVTIL